MPSHPPNEFDNENDPCYSCTRSDCTACPNQPDTDRLLGINALAGLKEDLLVAVEDRFKEKFEDTNNNEDDEEDNNEEKSIIQTQVVHRQSTQTPLSQIIDVELHEDHSAAAEKPRRGAPKGNRNAVKHGLYISGRSIRNITPLERAQAMDFLEIINNFKDYMNATYQSGLKAKSIEEVNATMQTLSVAVMALNRLIHLHHEFDTSFSSDEFKITSKTTASQLEEYYQKKCATFMDLSDLQPSPTNP